MITKKQRYFIRFKNNCRSFFLANVSSIKLKWNRVPFNGAQVDLENVNPSCGEEEFSKDLADAVKYWRRDGKRTAWLRVPISHSRFIPEAFKQNFKYHHAVDNVAMLVKWLPDHVSNKVPAFATHQVGVAGAVVKEDTEEVLVVQDKQKYRIGPVRQPVWKFPGGLSDEAEDIGQTAEREVFEETGVATEFQSLLLFRQQHFMKTAWNRSDIYAVTRLKPLSYNINHCKDEIEKCEWMKIRELLVRQDTTPLLKLVCKLILHGLQNGFEQVDIKDTEMRSWVDPRRTFKLYHRPLPFKPF